MLKRFLFRWQKTILSLILWLCLLAVWLRSGFNSAEDNEPKPLGGHARHQRRVSRLNHIARFDQREDSNLHPPDGDNVIEFLEGSKLTPSHDRRRSRHYKQRLDHGIGSPRRGSLEDPGTGNHDTHVVDIQIESKSYLNVDVGDGGDGGGGGDGGDGGDVPFIDKDNIDIDSGNEIEHLQIGSLSQKLLAKIRGNGSSKTLAIFPGRVSIEQRDLDASARRRFAHQNKNNHSKTFKSNPSHRDEFPPLSDLNGNPDGGQYDLSRSQKNILKDPGDPLQTNTPRCIVDGIYWTPDFIRLLPRGIEPADADRWLKSIRNSHVTKLSSPQWNRCGRPKNGYAQMDDGSGVCARYRSPNTRLVKGEILSYWLARYLGLTTVPPVCLSLVNSGQWSLVTDNVRDMGWDGDQFVALIMWMDNVDSSYNSKIFMPGPILDAIRLGIPLSLRRSHRDKNGCGKGSGLRPDGSLDADHDSILLNYLERTPKINKHAKVAMETMIQIAQWSNLIIFDYITANYDRVASMQDAADKDKNPAILAESIRNLHKAIDSPLLWLLDNESGLLDAYELMYRGGKAGSRFHAFHRTMLRSLCVFDKNLVDKIRDIHGFDQPDVALEELTREEEPSLSYIKADSSHVLFQSHFKTRLKDVLDWVDECQGRLV